MPRGFAFGGIAAANVEIEGCNVNATTIHNLFDLDGNLTSKLDFSKANVEKVAVLVQMQVLFLDEARCSDQLFCGPSACVTRCRFLCSTKRSSRPLPST